MARPQCQLTENNMGHWMWATQANQNKNDNLKATLQCLMTECNTHIILEGWDGQDRVQGSQKTQELSDIVHIPPYAVQCNLAPASADACVVDIVLLVQEAHNELNYLWYGEDPQSRSFVTHG